MTGLVNRLELMLDLRSASHSVFRAKDRSRGSARNLHLKDRNVGGLGSEDRRTVLALFSSSFPPWRYTGVIIFSFFFFFEVFSLLMLPVLFRQARPRRIFNIAPANFQLGII